MRITTYNIHKCQGFDRRIRPARIIDVLKSIDADIICLQEVVHSTRSEPHFNQANLIAAAFPEHTLHFGSNRSLYNGDYGNLTLSRLPVTHAHNHSITHAQREPRGALHTDHNLSLHSINTNKRDEAFRLLSDTSPKGSFPTKEPSENNDPKQLHVFNVHLGTGFMERRHQAAKLLSDQILGHERLTGPRIILGDFNEWTRGLTSVLLRQHFQTFEPHYALGYARTFPSLAPILTLDFCFYESPLKLVHHEVHRSPLALIASDHLPLVMDFDLE